MSADNTLQAAIDVALDAHGRLTRERARFKMSDAAFVRAMAHLDPNRRKKCDRLANAIDEHVKAYGFVEPDYQNPPKP